MIGGKELRETSYAHSDELGILRDSGKLGRAELPYDAAHGSPHVLPEEIYFTQFIFACVSNRCRHAGVNHVLA